MIIIPPPVPPLRNFKGASPDEYKRIAKKLEEMQQLDDTFMRCIFGGLLFGLAVELVILGGVVFYQYFA